MLNETWNFEVKLDELRNEEGRFWNMIYYFNEFHLPYEFILPYEDKQFETDFKQYVKRGKKKVGIQK